MDAIQKMGQNIFAQVQTKLNHFNMLFFTQWCNLTLARRLLSDPNVYLRASKFPKYVCLVARLGEQPFENQILKIVLDIL